MQIKIERIAFGGDGVGFSDGKACFVEGALPGETVEIKILQDKKNFLKGKLLKVIEASPDRVEPPCPYTAYCGGCQYQHVRYAKELEFKHSQIREIFERNFKLPPGTVQPIRFTPHEYRYRNSVTLHADSKSASPQYLGFIGKDNKTRVIVKDCLLADEKLTPVFTSKFRPKDREEEISFRLSKEGEIFTSQREMFFSEQVLDESIKTSSKGFFQNNIPVASLLIRQITEWLERLKPDDFFDLYAGSGLFSFFAAKIGGRVFSLEENPFSLAALQMNREDRKLTSMTIVKGRVEREFKKLFESADFKRPVLLMDPPRQGMARELAEFISLQSSIPAVIYVSCDPMTLARDLKLLTEPGNLSIREVVPFDMFPKTKHIETAVLLERTEKA